jgi:hypothetical protein
MASNLELATRLDGDDGRHVARLSDERQIWRPNGGYLVAIA